MLVPHPEGGGGVRARNLKCYGKKGPTKRKDATQGQGPPSSTPGESTEEVEVKKDLDLSPLLKRYGWKVSKAEAQAQIHISRRAHNHKPKPLPLPIPIPETHYSSGSGSEGKDVSGGGGGRSEPEPEPLPTPTRDMDMDMERELNGCGWIGGRRKDPDPPPPPTKFTPCLNCTQSTSPLALGGRGKRGSRITDVLGQARLKPPSPERPSKLRTERSEGEGESLEFPMIIN
jgi:hypothetical protein